MCGIAGVFGPGATRGAVEAMVRHQHHRGPDADWVHADHSSDLDRPPGVGSRGVLGTNRLSIIDRSALADEPLISPNGTRIAFNGEIYNHVELRRELSDYPFRTRTDTEVLLAAHHRWGEACLERLVGMFSVLFWNEATGRLLAARDRFGVKPLHVHRHDDGTLFVASEIGALFAAGVPAVPDDRAWSTYLTSGMLDHRERTFWDGITRVLPGHLLRWHAGRTVVEPWYDVVAATGPDDDTRPVNVVADEYRALLADSVRLRFRSDVPVGVNLSGGVDSATLLGLVGELPGGHPPVAAYTFATGDDRYDETPWVRAMLAGTEHSSSIVALRPDAVPELARSVQATQDEPFGGLPTLAYARLFEEAHSRGTVVLLDGQGMDEQWAGYDYHQHALAGGPSPVVQGLSDRPVRPECLVPEFRSLALPFDAPSGFRDPLRALQHRDLSFTKLPRALRFNDRASMRASVELREPFLDHRLVELALRQPADRKVRDGVGKWLLRQIAADLLPTAVAQAPKRPVQTPQREWLRGPLRPWADEQVRTALEFAEGRWLDRPAVRTAWEAFLAGEGANGYFAWQWVNLGLAVDQRPAAFGRGG